MDHRLNDREWLEDAYTSGRGIEDIAAQLQCSRNTVRNRMVAFGIDRRARSAHFKGQPKPAEQRAKMSSARKAYWESHPDREAHKLRVSQAKRKTGMRSGYRHIYVPGRGYMQEHRYVMEMALGHRLRRDEVVHHLDGNKLNNVLSNLQVVSPQEHARIHYDGINLPVHAHDRHDTNGQFLKTGALPTGRKNGGEAHPEAKLTNEQARQIRIRAAQGERQKQLAQEYGISPVTVSHIVTRYSWRDVD